MNLKHNHPHCVACFHYRAHGTYDGFSFVTIALIKAGYTEAAAYLDRERKRLVNREVRRLARIAGIDSQELAALMRHHDYRD